jgi:hypothetical protein
MKKITAILIATVIALTFTACDNNRQYDPPAAESPHEGTTAGDAVEFGDTVWRVLDVQDGRALLISWHVLEQRAYHSESVSVTWEESDIRAYLNGDFLSRFSDDDRAKIAETEVVTADNAEREISGGNDTTDYIFLLSADEVETYFTGDMTLNATNMKRQVNWWWLRSPGFLANRVVCVEENALQMIGADVTLDFGGVRPALWLTL